MGNCIDILFSQPQEKIRVLIFNGGEEEFTSPTPVEKITSGPYHGYKLVHHTRPYLPLPPNSKLISGEVYYLVPPQAQPCSRPVSSKTIGDNGCRGRSVKIVVTKQQLDLLLRSAKQFQSKDVAVRLGENIWEREGCRKWRPSLATIPEFQNC